MKRKATKRLNQVYATSSTPVQSRSSVFHEQILAAGASRPGQHTTINDRGIFLTVTLVR
jgi:hypothetical protein